MTSNLKLMIAVGNAVLLSGCLGGSDSVSVSIGGKSAPAATDNSNDTSSSTSNLSSSNKSSTFTQQYSVPGGTTSVTTPTSTTSTTTQPPLPMTAAALSKAASDAIKVLLAVSPITGSNGTKITFTFDIGKAGYAPSKIKIDEQVCTQTPGAVISELNPATKAVTMFWTFSCTVSNNTSNMSSPSATFPIKFDGVDIQRNFTLLGVNISNLCFTFDGSPISCGSNFINGWSYLKVTNPDYANNNCAKVGPEGVFLNSCPPASSSPSFPNMKPSLWYMNFNTGEIVTDSSGSNGVLCLDVSGNRAGDNIPVIAYKCTGTDNQKWKLYPDQTLVSASSSKCLSFNPSDTRLVQKTCNNTDPNMKWSFETSTAPAQWFVIRSMKNPSSDSCMQINSQDTNGASVKMVDNCSKLNYSDPRRYFKYFGEKDRYQFGTVTVGGKAFVFDIANGTSNVGEPLQTWELNSGSNQQWKFLPETQQIQRTGTDLCLQNADGLVKQGVCLTASTIDPSFQWRLDSVTFKSGQPLFKDSTSTYYPMSYFVGNIKQQCYAPTLNGIIAGTTSCTSSNWYYDQNSGELKYLNSDGTYGCMTMSNNAKGNGTTNITLQTCNGQNFQKWRFLSNPNRLMNLGNANCAHDTGLTQNFGPLVDYVCDYSQVFKWNFNLNPSGPTNSYF